MLDPLFLRAYRVRRLLAILGFLPYTTPYGLWLHKIYIALVERERAKNA